jgi:DsbC/DsbD-like thiol-disulfide interchange protein
MISTFFALATLATAGDEGWGPPAIVSHDEKPCVAYRAQFSAGRLAISVKLEPGWHTFTLDNDKRASAKLNGRKALSADKPTQIEAEGLTLAGPWLQPEPKDFSQPELRIFSWGYENSALFVAPATLANSNGPRRVRIKGQACTQTVCKNVDVTAEVVESKSATPTAGLIAVR